LRMYCEQVFEAALIQKYVLHGGRADPDPIKSLQSLYRPCTTLSSRL
jgi:hypothetical protein